MAVGLIYPDDTVPLTVFYDTFRTALQARPDYTASLTAGDLAFPHEDVTLETNWPRYGRNKAALLRGDFNDVVYSAYLTKVLACPTPVCVINMQPYTIKQEYILGNPHVILADGCLTTADRGLNQRTVSMPALPLVAGSFDAGAKKRVASFRGAATHPIREALTSLNASPGFLCEVVGANGYYGKIDATAGVVDSAYYDLLNESLFAIVPRGDTHFSYRLLEALSFGCIPIILSDGWVLPFDRTIPWRQMSLHVPEAAYERIPELLARLSPETILILQNKVVEVYQRYLSNFEVIVDTLIGEIGQVLSA